MIGKTHFFVATIALVAACEAGAEDWMREGGRQMASGDIQSAAATYAAASQANPFDPVALNNQAVALAAKGDLNSAMVLLKRAVRLAPGRKDIAANLEAVRSQLEQGDSYAVRGYADSSDLQLYPDRLPPEPPKLWLTSGATVQGRAAKQATGN